MMDEAAIRLRWDTVGSRLDERGRRLFAAAEVRTAGRGGLATVSQVTGLARSTINRGEKDSGGWLSVIEGRARTSNINTDRLELPIVRGSALHCGYALFGEAFGGCQP
jgi:hypothetical protein